MCLIPPEIGLRAYEVSLGPAACVKAVDFYSAEAACSLLWRWAIHVSSKFTA
jgi:hypothetical protein